MLMHFMMQAKLKQHVEDRRRGAKSTMSDPSRALLSEKQTTELSGRTSKSMIAGGHGAVPNTYKNIGSRVRDR